MKYHDLVVKKEIRVGAYKLQDGDLDVLTKVLQTSTVLEELNLNRNPNTFHRRKFTDALANNHTLKVLSLFDNRLGNEGAKQLAAALKVNTTLQHINLGGNDIGHDGARLLADALVVNTNLRTVALSCNKIGDEGAKCFAESLLANKWLCRLYLDDNCITGSGAKTLANALLRNRTMAVLSLCRNQVDYLWKNAIKHTIEDPDRRKDQPELNFRELVNKKEILLNGMILRDADLKVITRVIQESKVLEVLDLSLNIISLDDEKFSDALARNRTLKRLTLCHNSIGANGAKKLAGALKENQTLEHVDLGHNQIGKEGAKSLAEALVVNENLKYVSLSHNDIGDSGVWYLAAALFFNRTLRKLWLPGNNITEKGARGVASALKRNNTIDHIYLGGNRISENMNSVSSLGGNSVSTNIMSAIEYLLEDPKRKECGAEKSPIYPLETVASLLREKVDEIGAVNEMHNIQTAIESLMSAGLDSDSEEEDIRMLKEDIAEKEAEIEQRKVEIASKNDEIASLRKALGIDVVDLTGGDRHSGRRAKRSGRVIFKQKKKPRRTSGADCTGGASTTIFTRSKRSTAKIKQEDIINGNVQCPECPRIIPFTEGRCNIMVCTNHSPQYLYFCIHCKRVNDNGMEYATCRCASRNTKEARIKAQKIRNEMSTKNPVDLI